MFDKHRNLNSALALHGLQRKYSPLICREPPSSSSGVICMYYKLQCWLAIFRQLPRTAQHPCASLSIPALAGGDRSSLGVTRDAQGRMLAAAWHQVTQAMGSISPGKTRVSPHPSSYPCLLSSNVQALRGWGRWERTKQPQALGAPSWPPLGHSLGVREWYGWALELVDAAGDSVLCF